MVRGVFDEYEDARGKRVYRLRWVNEAALSGEEAARAHFIRYLVQRGSLNEQSDLADEATC